VVPLGALGTAAVLARGCYAMYEGDKVAARRPAAIKQTVQHHNITVK
jgi:hypothetical protein